MMRKILSVIVVTLIALLLVIPISAANGADGATHYISNCAELLASDDNADDIGDVFILTDNIDCSSTPFTSLWEDAPFTGTFNGNFRAITGLTITGFNSNHGLFSQTSGATMSNVFLRDINIEGLYDTGGLIGNALNTSITNVHVDGYIDSDGSTVGFIAGKATNSDINFSSGQGTINANSEIGGVAGQLASEDSGISRIRNSYGVVEYELNEAFTNHEGYGGLVGAINAIDFNGGDATVVIEDSHGSLNVNYRDPEVINVRGMGGLIGKVSMIIQEEYEVNVSINRTYGSGDISVDYDAGGLIGWYSNIDSANKNLSVSNSFAFTSVAADELPGGLIGRGVGTDHSIVSVNNFFDVTLSGQSDCAGEDPITVGCTAITQEDYFFGNNTNGPLDSWNFNGTQWSIYGEGLPPVLNIDADGDGIRLLEELGGPNGGDSDENGILDIYEPNIAAFQNVSGYYQLISVSSGIIKSLATQAHSDTATQSFPFGMTSFEIEVDDTDPVTIEMVYFAQEQEQEQADNFTPWKLNSNNDLVPIVGVSKVDSTRHGQNVVVLQYDAVDGGINDQDGTIDGVITDPVGLSTVLVPSQVPPEVIPAPSQTSAVGTLSATGLNSQQMLIFALFLVASGVVIFLTNKTRRSGD